MPQVSSARAVLDRTILLPVSSIPFYRWFCRHTYLYNFISAMQYNNIIQSFKSTIKNNAAQPIWIVLGFKRMRMNVNCSTRLTRYKSFITCYHQFIYEFIFTWYIPIRNVVIFTGGWYRYLISIILVNLFLNITCWYLLYLLLFINILRKLQNYYRIVVTYLQLSSYNRKCLFFF